MEKTWGFNFTITESLLTSGTPLTLRQAQRKRAQCGL